MISYETEDFYSSSQSESSKFIEILKISLVRGLVIFLFSKLKVSAGVCLIVNLEAVAEKIEAPITEDLINSSEEEEPIKEPQVGMEFESEEAAREFCSEYARSVGFVVRLDQCRRSEVDRRILSRRFSCNKQGFYAKARISNSIGPAGKLRTSTREGCKAMMLVKLVKSGKWIVIRFFKEHTH